MADLKVTHTLVGLTDRTPVQVNHNFRDVTDFVGDQTVHRDGDGLGDAIAAYVGAGNMPTAIPGPTGPTGPAGPKGDASTVINIDGGEPSTVFGGVGSIDGGGV